MLLNLDAGSYRVVCVPSTGCKHPHLVALVVSLDHRLQTNAPTPSCLLPSNKTPVIHTEMYTNTDVVFLDTTITLWI